MTRTVSGHHHTSTATLPMQTMGVVSGTASSFYRILAVCLPLTFVTAVVAQQSSGGFDLATRKSSHWAWRPVVALATPGADEAPGASTPIDAFLLTKLHAAGVARASAADKRTLIRRATFDLAGLPPTPQEVAEFEADSSTGAFEKVVDRLLASPRFGERWTRHWLDVVRYAETLGHEFDYPLTDAWRYRDYVIRALNADLPYDQFVREHIAGDLLDPPRQGPTEGSNESILATAFWYMGEATHAPVDTRADQATRIENQVDVLSKAFLGLTVACARCHDHKFDAISTQDYYALAGYAASSHQQTALLDEGGQIEAGARRLGELLEQGRAAACELPVQGGEEAAADFARCLLAARDACDVEAATEREEIARRYRVERLRLDRFVSAVEDARQDLTSPLHAWSIVGASGEGAHAFDLRRRELGAAIERQSAEIAAVRTDQRVFEDFDNLNDWFGAGWAFGSTATGIGDWTVGAMGPNFLAGGLAHSGRYGGKLQGVVRSPKFTIEKPFIHYRLAGRGGAKVRVIVDGYTMDNFSALLVEGLSFDVDTDGQQQWHIQSTARHIGHRAHIELVDHGDGFLAVDEIRFADAETPEPTRDDIGELAMSRPGVQSVETLARAYGDVWANSLDDWRAGESSIGSEFVRWALTHGLACEAPNIRSEVDAIAAQAAACEAALLEPTKVVAIADGGGEDWRVQHGGSYKRLGPLAPRQLLEAIAGTAQPAPRHGSGRLELAERVLSPDNPFPARVMANRIWAHLFGRGIVATVDNFGVLGERPTHPELLDYLATRFRDGGWSVKSLVREIMLSDAYQASCVGNAASNGLDPQNRLLHRANLRRLEGEAVRDSLLAISGRLDDAQFGPSIPIHLTAFMDGRGRPTASGPLDGAGRRSIYLEVRRNFLSPMMLAYDTPPPSSCVGQRNNSNVPAQSLIMMNDPFVIEQCRHWAERVLANRNPLTADRIDDLYLTAFNRRPTAAEVEAATAFLVEQSTAYGAAPDDVRVWADLCHVLVNVKDFVFLE